MRIALYMRMSTDKQENSIDSQLGVLEAYAKSRKMKVVEKYIDEGISGRTAENRPAFMRMIDDSAKDLFDAVLVYDSSRFARNLEESIVFKSLLKKNNVELISATEPTLDEDSALITDAMLGALNEMYSRKLSKAVKRGMIFNAQKGKHQSPPPFGYRKENKTMLIDEVEANVVRRIFDMFLENPSWHGIAVKLNLNRVPKRNAYGWYGRDIKRMMLNLVYIGKVYYDGNYYDGEHEPIISPEVWKKTQAIINERPEGTFRPPLAYSHWLSGLLKCGNCGGRMSHTSDTRGGFAYRCSKHSNGCCETSNFLSINKLEILVMASINLMMNQKDLSEYEFFVPRRQLETGIGDLQAALRKVRSRLDRHKDAYSSGVDNLQEYKENKSKCLAEEKAIQEKIESLTDEGITKEKTEYLKGRISELLKILPSKELTIEQKSIAIKQVVNRIVVDKNAGNFTVYYFI